MVKYIEYKNKQYPVRLSYIVIKKLKSLVQSEKDLEKLESLDPATMETMLWFGLIAGHKYMDQTLTLKQEEMEDVLDAVFFDFLKIIPAFFPKSKMGNGMLNLGEEQEEESQQEQNQQQGSQQEQADQTT